MSLTREENAEKSVGWSSLEASSGPTAMADAEKAKELVGKGLYLFPEFLILSYDQGAALEELQTKIEEYYGLAEEHEELSIRRSIERQKSGSHIRSRARVEINLNMGMRNRQIRLDSVYFVLEMNSYAPPTTTHMK